MQSDTFKLKTSK